MTRHCRAMATREEPEPVVEPGRKFLYPKGSHTRCRKLDCQRDAVEATTNSDYGGCYAGARRKVWRGRTCSLDEQPDGAVAKRFLAIRATFRRHSERRYRVNPLALCPEWLAAPGKTPRRPGGARQTLRHFFDR